MSLPIKYFEEGRYPLSFRPSARVPAELIDPESHTSIDQQQISHIFSTPNSIPKWVRTAVINELKTLFLRTRLLDQSSKNIIIKDFLAVLFPTFVNNHPDKVGDIARTFRKNWTSWRSVLWDKINERFKLCQKRKDKSDSGQPITSYLKNQHLNEIFSLWFKFSHNSLSQENIDSLRNLIFFAFHCIESYQNDAHGRFYTYNGDLYTVNNIFNSSSGFNIAASLDLSKYEIADWDEETIIIDSSSESETPKSRTKRTKKRSGVKKSNN